MSEKKDPGVTCPECGHHFELGIADAMRNAMAGWDSDSAYVQGYQEAVQYWLFRLFAGGVVLGAVVGVAFTKVFLQ